MKTMNCNEAIELYASNMHMLSQPVLVDLINQIYSNNWTVDIEDLTDTLFLIDEIFIEYAFDPVFCTKEIIEIIENSAYDMVFEEKLIKTIIKYNRNIKIEGVPLKPICDNLDSYLENRLLNYPGSEKEYSDKIMKLIELLLPVFNFNIDLIENRNESLRSKLVDWSTFQGLSQYSGKEYKKMLDKKAGVNAMDNDIDILIKELSYYNNTLINEKFIEEQ